MSRIDGMKGGDAMAAGSYVALFLAYLVQLPLRGLLPGNTDTLLAIALSNHILEKLGLFFSGAAHFTAMYPAGNVLAYGENCYGIAGLFLIFKLLTSSDIWGYYLFLVTLFSLNAFAMFKWAGLFVKDRRISWLAGLTFALSGFLFGNVDDPNMVLLLFPIMAFYYLELWLREGRRSDLTATLLLSATQIWFGFYIFLFQFMALLLAALFYRKEVIKKLKLTDAGPLARAFLLPCVPLLALYFYNHFFANVFSPYDPQLTAGQTSMSWHSFRNVVPGNLLYSDARNTYDAIESSGWGRIRKSGFLGFALPVLAVLGVWSYRRKAGYYLLLFLVFLPLSFGLHLPGYHLLMSLPFGEYLRVPARFFLFALLPLALFGALGLQRLAAERRRYGIALAVAAACLVLLENSPASIAGFDAREWIYPPASYVRFFQDFKKPAVVLDLPSTCFYRGGDKPNEGGLWFYNRDILYMNWQTYHKQLIAGGVNSYVAATRAEADRDFQEAPAPEALLRLRSRGIDYIVFHKDLVLLPSEDIYSRLKASPLLSERMSDQRISIFEIDEAALNRSLSEAAVRKALRFLASSQDGFGEFQSTVCDRSGRCWKDSTPFITGFVLDSLAGLQGAEVSRMRARALEFLQEEMLPGGIWRFWTFRAPYVPILQPDLDDTAVIANALLSEGKLSADNRDLIRRNMDNEGRFLTWLLPKEKSLKFDFDPAASLRNSEFRPHFDFTPDSDGVFLKWIKRSSFPNEIDPAVNANVLLYLREEIPSVCSYLNQAAARGEPSVYYLDEPAQYYMYGRAFRRGIRCLEPSRNPIAARLALKQTPDGSFGSPQDTALSLNILEDFGVKGPWVDSGIHSLLSAQKPDGSWDDGFFFKESAYCKECRYWRSKAFSTALGIEALVKRLASSENLSREDTARSARQRDR